MIKGTMKSDAVAVMELSVSFLEGPASLKAKAAFVNTRTGQTHGSTNHHSWSPETHAALQTLKKAMEVDLAKTHLVDYADEVNTSSVTKPAGAPGLGEHMRGDDDAEPA